MPSVAHAKTIVVSPDMMEVSDGIGSYSVLTLSGKDAMARIPEFGQVESCSLVVDIPEGVADGNNTYGALCKKRSGTSMRKVFVCYDHMVGHSNIVFVHNKDANKFNLIIFTYSSCFGG
jgi:hypothetical protein